MRLWMSLSSRGWVGRDWEGKGQKEKRQQNTARLDSAEGEAHNAWRKNKNKNKNKGEEHISSVYLPQCTDVCFARGRGKKKEKKGRLLFPQK